MWKRLFALLVLFLFLPSLSLGSTADKQHAIASRSYLPYPPPPAAFHELWSIPWGITLKEFLAFTEDELNLQLQPYKPQKDDVSFPYATAYELASGQDITIWGYPVKDVIFLFTSSNNFLYTVYISLSPLSSPSPASADEGFALLSHYFQALTEKCGPPRATHFQAIFSAPVLSDLFALPIQEQHLNVDELRRVFRQENGYIYLSAAFDNILLYMRNTESPIFHTGESRLGLYFSSPLGTDILHYKELNIFSLVQPFEMYDKGLNPKPIEALEPMPTLRPEITPYSGFPGYREMGL